LIPDFIIRSDLFDREAWEFDVDQGARAPYASGVSRCDCGDGAVDTELRYSGTLDNVIVEVWSTVARAARRLAIRGLPDKLSYKP
jgi:hypothetical protein